MRDIKLYIMLKMDYKMIFIKLKGKSWKFKEEKKRYRKKSLKVIKKMPKYIVSILYNIPNKKYE